MDLEVELDVTLTLLGERAHDQHALGLGIRFVVSVRKVRYEEPKVVPLRKIEITLRLSLQESNHKTISKNPGFKITLTPFLYMNQS